METKFCPCGDTKTRVEKFATQNMLVCAKCGDPILNDDNNPIIIPEDRMLEMEFNLFCYNHSRDEIRTEVRTHYDNNQELLKEAWKIKDCQVEETIKRNQRENSSESE